VLVTTETLVKHLAFVNSATAKMSWLEMISLYTDKLICRGYAELQGSNDDFD